MVNTRKIETPILDATGKIPKSLLPTDLAGAEKLNTVEKTANDALTTGRFAQDRADAAYILAETGSTGTIPVAAAVGFIAPAWGVAPSARKFSKTAFLFGQLERQTANFETGTTLVTSGAWLAGQKFTALSSAGVVLLRTTATTIEFDQTLTGTSPVWVSLDSVRINLAS